MIAALLFAGIAFAAPLETRVLELEQELARLRGRVEALELAAKSTPAPTVQAMPCYLRTAFDGTFTGANAAAVVEACRAKAKSGIYCQEKDVQCAR